MLIVVGAILNLMFLFLFLLMLLPDDTDAESEEAAERNEDLHAVQEETKEAYSGAFESWAVYELPAAEPPIDLIGFDCCLMATIDVADVFSGISQYLVASEELEPGCGWDYAVWSKKLFETPNMSGADLGAAIYDSFLAGTSAYNVEEKITLSVTDLSKMPRLIAAFDAL